MVNFPEGWGKGHLPEGWGKKAGSSSEKDKNTDNLIENVEESEQDFLTGDEIKAKLGSELSNFKKVLDTHTDAIKNSTKYVGKKSNKVSEEKQNRALKLLKIITFLMRNISSYQQNQRWKRIRHLSIILKIYLQLQMKYLIIPKMKKVRNDLF